MYDQLGSWVIFAAVTLLVLYYGVRGLMGKQPIRDEKRTHTPLTLHTPRETPADAEWRRRMQRWRAEQGDLS